MHANYIPLLTKSSNNSPGWLTELQDNRDPMWWRFGPDLFKGPEDVKNFNLMLVSSLPCFLREVQWRKAFSSLLLPHLPPLFVVLCCSLPPPPVWPWAFAFLSKNEILARNSRTWKTEAGAKEFKAIWGIQWIKPNLGYNKTKKYLLSIKEMKSELTYIQISILRVDLIWIRILGIS